MASKYINNTDQLPSQFSIESYSDCAFFKAEDWWVELSKRHSLRKMSDEGRLKIDFMLNFLFQPIGQARASLKLLESTEVMDVVRRVSEKEILEVECIKHEFPEGYEFDSSFVGDFVIRPVSLMDVKNRISDIDLGSFSDAILDRVTLNGLGRKGSGNILVSIDPQAPDEVLFNSFKNMLRQVRRRSELEVSCSDGGGDAKKRCGSVTEKKMSRLNQFKILPYLDLLLWSELNSKKIKPSVFAAALAPRGELGERDIKEKTAVLAEEAIGEVFINGLREKVGLVRAIFDELSK